MFLSFIFSLYLLMGLSGESLPQGTACEPVAHTTVEGAVKLERKDKLRGIEENHNRGEALLDNARDIYRVCGSRPQRVLPIYGSKPNKATGKHALSVLPSTNRFHSFTSNLCKAPLPFAVSSSYYVYMLRRLLC